MCLNKVISLSLLCFNVDHTDVIPQTYLNGEVIPVVDSDKHLGNYISTNITDRNIIDNICDLYQRSNRVISDFRVCDSNALDSLHRTYCMHMYGCELWDLNCNYIKDFKVAWRNIHLSMGVTLEDWTVSQIICADDHKRPSHHKETIIINVGIQIVQRTMSW